MTHNQLKKLKPGDIIRHCVSANSFIVTDTYGERAMAVRTIEVTNPAEWELVNKESSKWDRIRHNLEETLHLVKES